MLPAVIAPIVHHPSDLSPLYTRGPGRAPGCRRTGEKDRRQQWRDRRLQEDRRDERRRDADSEQIYPPPEHLNFPQHQLRERRNSFQNRRAGWDRRHTGHQRPCRVFVEPFLDDSLVTRTPSKRLGNHLDILA